MFAPLPAHRQYQDVPDKCNLVYLFMVMFGIGSILPFSAMTTAIEFFNKHVRFYSELKLFS
jgi:hypothetical protein